MWFLYRTATVLLAPVWLLYLALRQRGNLRLRERLGLLKERRDAPIWIQAVSVGEVRIALRLASALKELGFPVALTSTTAAGLALAQSEGPGELAPQAFPLDLPACARRALRRLHPRALVLIETEIWPALLREARTAGVPSFVVNARLSDRALARTLRFKGLYERSLRNVRISAQSEEHAARFHLLGALPDHILVHGNLKYDLKPPATFQTASESLEKLLGEGPLWVAGSVREGEEGAVVQALETVRKSLPEARLIMAPRHLNRAGCCLEASRRQGFAPALRSEEPAGGWDVLVLDTVGELWSAYALGRAAFVGGSLVPLGGQNVLEPAFLGRPVLFGPHTENFREDAERLVASGGGMRVESAEDLGRRLADLLIDPALAQSCGERAREVVLRHVGALERTARWLTDQLPGV